MEHLLLRPDAHDPPLRHSVTEPLQAKVNFSQSGCDGTSADWVSGQQAAGAGGTTSSAGADSSTNVKPGRGDVRNIRHARVGRAGTEIWSIVPSTLQETACVELTNLSPAQCNAIVRFRSHLRAWGFVLEPLRAQPTAGPGGATSSFFSVQKETEQGQWGHGAEEWKLVGVPVVMGTPLGRRHRLYCNAEIACEEGKVWERKGGGLCGAIRGM
jgi:hypothetical protein